MKNQLSVRTRMNPYKCPPQWQTLDTSTCCTTPYGWRLSMKQADQYDSQLRNRRSIRSRNTHRQRQHLWLTFLLDDTRYSDFILPEIVAICKQPSILLSASCNTKCNLIDCQIYAITSIKITHSKESGCEVSGMNCILNSESWDWTDLRSERRKR